MNRGYTAHKCTHNCTSTALNALSLILTVLTTLAAITRSCTHPHALTTLTLRCTVTTWRSKHWSSALCSCTRFVSLAAIMRSPHCTHCTAHCMRTHCSTAFLPALNGLLAAHHLGLRSLTALHPHGTARSARSNHGTHFTHFIHSRQSYYILDSLDVHSSLHSIPSATPAHDQLTREVAHIISHQT